MSLLKTFLALTLAIATSALAESQTAIRVMSFNIRNSGAKDGENHWQHRKDLYVKTIKDFDPDLLGTQEVLADQFDTLGQVLPEYGVVGVARDDGKREGEWSAILYRKSRFQAVDSGTFWLSETPDEVGSRAWKAACVRICSWARLRETASGREFLYANTHYDHESKLAREESSKLLRTRLPELAKGAPVILSGDFNCIEDDAPYRALVGPSDGKSVALVDSYREVHPERKPDEASFNGFKGTVAGSRIDWILHSPEFKAAAAEIVRPKSGRLPSDHYAVTAVIRLSDAN